MKGFQETKELQRIWFGSKLQAEGSACCELQIKFHVHMIA